MAGLMAGALITALLVIQGLASDPGGAPPAGSPSGTWLPTLLWRFALGSLITAGITLAAVRLTFRRSVLTQVSALRRQVSRIADNDFSQSLNLEERDELADLAASIETLRARLLASRTQQERRLEELQLLDRMKDEFLANTSHEFKTPLNGIIGLAESLLIGSHGEISKEQKEPLELINSCASRLWKLTESLLRFLRLEREKDRQDSRPEAHLLYDHLDEALRDLRVAAETAGLHLVVSIPRDFQAVYLTDELEQILRILVDNAIKYTERGLVQVLAARWQNASQPGFQVAVRDTGIGIPGELHTQIFEPFFQASRDQDRAKGGVGLGLSIAKTLAGRLNGEILVDSTVGKGSVFTVLVPEGERKEDLRKLFKPWAALTDSVRLCLESKSEPITAEQPEVASRAD